MKFLLRLRVTPGLCVRAASLSIALVVALSEPPASSCILQGGVSSLGVSDITSRRRTVVHCSLQCFLWSCAAQVCALELSDDGEWLIAVVHVSTAQPRLFYPLFPCLNCALPLNLTTATPLSCIMVCTSVFSPARTHSTAPHTLEP